MTEVNVLLYGVVLIFTFSITVMIGLTILQVVTPEMSKIANQSSFINATEYEEDQTIIWDFTKIALFICIAIPFVFIAMTLLYKKEPVAYLGDDY